MLFGLVDDLGSVPVPTLDNSQPPITLVPGDSMPSCENIHVHIYFQIVMIFNSELTHTQRTLHTYD